MKLKLFTLLILSMILFAGCSGGTEKTGSNQTSKDNKPEIVKVMIQKVDPENFYVVTTADGNKLDYSYYVIKDKKTVKRYVYKKDAHLAYKVNEPGNYKVRVFIKDKDGNKASEYTETIKMGQ
jgi:ABC-type Fe3+-hydroxamate transport system substrate-binding protein